MTALIFIAILSFLVIIHEAGHFLVAKKNKIKVKEFGLGYPPRLVRLFRHKETIFSLNLIPFGGFVQLLGENGEEEGSSPDDSFHHKSAKARLAVILAGVLVNFIFGILAFAVVFYRLGIPEPLFEQNRISQILPNSPAAQAGLQINTNILAFKVNEQWVEVRAISEIQNLANQHAGETLSLRTTLPCENERCPLAYEEKSIYIRQQAEIPEGEGAMGIVFTDVVFKKYPWYLMPLMTIVHAFKQAFALAYLILQSLWQIIIDLLSGRGLQQEVAGPIGIIDQANTYGFFRGGFLNILNFAALLSINLGIMNLLPIPALDGGRALLILLEKVFQRKKIEQIAHYLNYFGYVSLLVLMILVSFNDIRNLFK